jgi:hypothetical protein
MRRGDGRVVVLTVNGGVAAKSDQEGWGGGG